MEIVNFQHRGKGLFSFVTLHISTFLPGRSGTSWSQPTFCRGPPTHGNFCRAFFRRWTYDSTKGRCVSFIYGGCNGTKNLFRSKEECRRTCDENLCN